MTRNVNRFYAYCKSRLMVQTIAVIDCRNSTFGFSGSSLISPQALLGLLLEGVRTNFWGLACPSYYPQPSFGKLGLVFLSGWISGVCCGLYLLAVWLASLGLGSFLELCFRAASLCSHDGEVRLQVSAPGGIQAPIFGPSASASVAPDLLGYILAIDG